MDFEGILSAVSSIGFSMAVAIAILVYAGKLVNRIMDENADTKDRLFQTQHESNDAINNNTKVLTELLAFLKGGSHNDC